MIVTSARAAVRKITGKNASGMGKHFSITQIVYVPLGTARISIGEYNFSRHS